MNFLDKFNNTEQASMQRMKAVEYSMTQSGIKEAVASFREKLADLSKTPVSFKAVKRKQIISELDDLLKNF